MLLDGTYQPVYTISGNLAFTIKTDFLNSASTTGKDGKTNGVTSLTIQGGWSSEIKDLYNVEDYPAKFYSADRTTAENDALGYVFMINNAQQITSIRNGSTSDSYTYTSQAENNAIPITFEGITFYNKSKNGKEGAAICYADQYKCTDTEGKTKSTTDLLGAPSDGSKKLTLKNCKIVASGNVDEGSTPSTAMYVGKGGGKALIYNVLFRDNTTDKYVVNLGENAYMVNCTVGKASGVSTTNRVYNSIITTRGESDDAPFMVYEKCEPLKSNKDLQYQLHENAYSIDKGTDDISNVQTLFPDVINYATDRDLLGNPRKISSQVDNGCYETWNIPTDETITAKSTDNEYPHEGSVVYIHDGGNLLLDKTNTIGSDGAKLLAMNDTLPQIYVVGANDARMSLASKAPVEEDIRLGFLAKRAGTYTVKAPSNSPQGGEPEAECLSEGDIWLTDHLTSTVVNLSESDYTMTVDDEGEYLDRITVRFGGSKPVTPRGDSDNGYIISVHGTTVTISGLSDGDNVRIVTTGGALFDTFTARNSEETRQLHKGYYVVSINGYAKTILCK